MNINYMPLPSVHRCAASQGSSSSTAVCCPGRRDCRVVEYIRQVVHIQPGKPPEESAESCDPSPGHSLLLLN